MNPSDEAMERESHWRKLEGRNPLPAPDPVRTALAGWLRGQHDYYAMSFAAHDPVMQKHIKFLKQSEEFVRAAPQPSAPPLTAPQPLNDIREFGFDASRHYSGLDKAVSADDLDAFAWRVLNAYTAVFPAEGGAREALEPFAAFADALNEDVPDNIAIGFYADGAMRFGPNGGATVGSLRKARAALAHSRPNCGGET